MILKAQNFLYTFENEFNPSIDIVDEKTSLVLTFGSQQLMFEKGGYEKIRKAFPHAEIVGCTSAGEMYNEDLYENSLVITAIEFDSSYVNIVKRPIDKSSNFKQIATELATELGQCKKLKHVFVLAEGVLVNGLDLVTGLNEGLPSGVAASGGLACNYTTLKTTSLWHNDSGPINQIIAIGFYGDNLITGYGSFGGWQPFGPKRKVTKSIGNIVYEIDGQPALDLYKKYLGAEAEHLPFSGMKFPIMITNNIKEKYGCIRGLNNIDEENKALIFAGDIKQGMFVNLMFTNTDSLVNAGFEAGKVANQMQNSQFAVMISCIGRKVVMERRTVEEIEDAREALGEECVTTGFYSFGELCPSDNSKTCLLQNQTMTITTFKETK